MMVEKYRVSDAAKDLGVDVKEVMDILEKFYRLLRLLIQKIS